MAKKPLIFESERLLRRADTLPTTMVRVHKGRETFTGVVLIDHTPSATPTVVPSNKLVLCDHNHWYEDMAMTCARRTRRKMELWR